MLRSKNQPSSLSPSDLPLKQTLRRILFLKFCLSAFFLVVGLRLIQIQLVESPKYKRIAKQQYESRVLLPATRGNIFDRQGKVLVSNAVFVSFGADPFIVGANAPAVAQQFSRAFGKSKEYYLTKLRNANGRFVWLERRVNPSFVRRVDAGALEGVIQMSEPQRLYHYGSVGAQTIGFTDIDNKGLSGIELQYDRELKGIDGYVIMQRDGLGRRRPSVDYPRIDPLNGKNIVLTIDLEYQSIVEEELRKGVERSHAESGLAVMVEPQTGAILAMANYPGLDPNNLRAADRSALKNRVITDMFEPGSVFKVVTASAALENNIVKPTQKFYAEQGRYRITLAGGKNRIISDTHEYGMLTFQEGMELSSNIVMAKVSDLVGAELLYTTARNYGFGIETGIELPGEVNGELKKPSQWSATTLNTMAYGYEVGVTPLQIAMAYATVANGGILMKPYIIKEMRDERNQTIAQSRPEVIRKVISAQTSNTLTQFFIGVVERGTGTVAKMEGMSVAGKTGTSRKFIDGQYSVGNYTASFVGFFPAEAPRVVCLVMLDNPHAGGYTGGMASAPIFKAIAQKVVALSGHFSKKDDGLMAAKERFAVPDVSNLTLDAAQAIITSQGLTTEVRGTGKMVLAQSPQPGTKVSLGDRVLLSMSAISSGGEFVVVPEVRGLALRRAMNRLVTGRLTAGITGSGIVVNQTPHAGDHVKPGTHVHLQCEPKPLTMVSLY